MRIALAQINPTIGDLEHNAGLALDAARDAAARGADLVVFPELSVCGYPPRDLVRRPAFVEACARASYEIGRRLPPGIAAAIGLPIADGDRCTNSLVVWQGGERIARYDKRLLPTYDVFDEDRYFVPGHDPAVVEIAGRRVGLALCEDLWRGEDAGYDERYRGGEDPIGDSVRAGAEVVVVASGSPFVLGKDRRHRALVQRTVERHRVPVLSVNQAGANDDLIFDGNSLAMDAGARVLARGPAFGAAVVVADLDGPRAAGEDNGNAPTDEENLYGALTLGVRDYCRKSGFGAVLVGLSGGIDSAVTAAIAAGALGAEAVTGVAMPSRYSSTHSVDDALDLASRLGVRCPVIPIAPPFDGFAEAADALFDQLGHARLGADLPDLAEENLQSRVRGTLMMTLSNRSGALLLSTGNKSEVAVGYSTLYGDMNGAVAVLADLTKRRVYALARWMNANHARCGFESPPIPERTIDKPPSAELRPDQRDQDSLPEYDVLDASVEGWIERGECERDIAERTGADAATVARIVRLIEASEYKRRQLPVTLKVTPVAFGPGRRYPVVARRGPWPST